jgi:glycosyltransferase involved in cell wall biosynthesis
MIYSKPLVSVAMVTSNGANHIDQQLRSIINQTYPNLEIIVTDDASVDETPAILSVYLNQYAHVKIFRNACNLGISPSFEHSIKNCKGDFIAISEQGDIWEPAKIEVLLHAMKNEDLIYADSELVDKTGKPLNKLISSVVNLGSFRSGIPFLMDVCLPGHTMLMQGDFARYILPIPRVVRYDRWISFCAAANNGIRYHDQPLTKYCELVKNYADLPGPGGNKKEKFHKKLLELKACEKAPVKDLATKKILQDMLVLFTRKISFGRSLFFFKNRNTLLSLKKKNNLAKILFCLKMFFKANY